MNPEDLVLMTVITSNTNAEVVVSRKDYDLFKMNVVDSIHPWVEIRGRLNDIDSNEVEMAYKTCDVVSVSRREINRL